MLNIFSLFSKFDVASPVKRVEIDDKPQQQQQQLQQHQQQQPQHYEFQTLRNDLREKSAKLESAMAEKNQLTRDKMP